MFIVSDHVVNAVDSWIENVSIHSEAVRGFLTIRWDGAPEAVQVNVLVRVVELENLANALDNLQVLVLKRVEVMQTVPSVRSTVG